MNATTTEQLKEFALIASSWDNCDRAWIDDPRHPDEIAVIGIIDEDDNKYPVVTIDCSQYDCPNASIKLAQFYAAANPTVVLQLIAKLAEVTKDLDYYKSRFEAITIRFSRTHGCNWCTTKTK